MGGKFQGGSAYAQSGGPPVGVGGHPLGVGPRLVKCEARPFGGALPRERAARCNPVRPLRPGKERPNRNRHVFYVETAMSQRLKLIRIVAQASGSSVTLTGEPDVFTVRVSIGFGRWYGEVIEWARPNLCAQLHQGTQRPVLRGPPDD